MPVITTSIVTTTTTSIVTTTVFCATVGASSMNTTAGIYSQSTSNLGIATVGASSITATAGIYTPSTSTLGTVEPPVSNTATVQERFNAFVSQLPVLQMRVNMLEGYVRQRPHVLGKFAAQVMTEVAELEQGLVELGLPAAQTVEYQTNLKEARDAAMLYFKAANGLSSLEVPAPVGQAQLFKLADHKVAPFSGVIREFPQWKEHYDAAVHNNPNLEDGHRMVHLLGAVKGEARDFLRGYPATAAYYQTAYSAFCARFGDPTKLAQTYYADLAALPDLHLQKDVTTKQNRENLDRLKTIILNLNATGGFDSDLVQGWVLRKLSKTQVYNSFMDLSRQFPKLDFPLQTLIEAVETRIYVSEVLDLRIASVGQGGESSKAEASSNLNEKFTTLINKTRQECLFCSGEHASVDCRKYLTYNERRKRLEEKKRCVICLGNSHRLGSCPNKDRTCRTCKRAGHTSVTCFEVIKKIQEKSNKPKDTRSRPAKRAKKDTDKKDNKDDNSSKSESDKSNSDKSASTSTAGTFLETFVTCVEIFGPRVLVRGVLDGGSNVSYIHVDVLNRLRIKLNYNVKLTVQNYGSEDHTSARCSSITVKFLNLHGQHRSCTLFTTNCIVGNAQLTPPPSVASTLLPSGYQYADLDLFSDSPRPIEILLGNDVRNLFVRLNRDVQLFEGLVLKPTFFGWVPSGRAVGSVTSSTTLTVSSKIENKGVEKSEFLGSPEISFLWDLETIGIKSSELVSNDGQVIEHFHQTTRFENGRYVVRWPRRKEDLDLPTHFRMALARLKSILRTTNNEVLSEYNKIITDLLNEGIIERAPRESRHAVHYIPHRPVVRKDKPIRMVLDASAKLKSGKSLNDMLHKGPSLTGSLIGIILNFRLQELGLSSDISKAFLRVGLDVVDRDLVRFLWVDDYTQSVDNITVVAYRFTRTPFGVVSSPFLLNMVLQELLSVRENPWYQLARERFYVDNLVLSVSNLEDAVQLFESVNDRLASGGFNLRDWISNSEEFNNSIPNDKRMSDVDCLSILGINWARRNDTLSIKFKDEEETPSGTLRSALSVLAAVFDPLGWCAPCLLDLKIYIQECWKISSSMDYPVPPLMEARFRKLLVEREDIKQITLPRYLWTTNSRDGSYELHGFSDASKLAYGCAIYLVHKTNFKKESQLIFSKLRIAPVQNRSIPQLELLAATVGVRALVFVRNSLDLILTKVVLWTDATTVIQWLHSSHIQPQFVQNKLKEIRQISNLVVRYVPTKDNPGDILSRGQRALQLRDNMLWWHGPTWLPHDQLWPNPPPNAPEFNTQSSPVVTLVTQAHKPSVPFLTDDFECKFSQWDKYVKFILRIPPIRKYYRIKDYSDIKSYNRAELILIRLIQQKYLFSELQQLQKEDTVNSDLNLFLHTDGIIRCRGRIEAAPLNWDTAHPIYLPRKSKLVRTLVRSIHAKIFHAGSEVTLTTFRERFWVSKGRVLVNSVIHGCNQCRRWKGGPYQLPPMPALPEIRMTPVVPFQNVGIDCFGPYTVCPPGTSTTIGVKSYGVLFTCLVTRAIHLELADRMTGDQFLLALIRFISRRGTPKFVVSDNGRNFTFIQPLIGHRVEITDSRVQSYFADNSISWYFIRAYNPWEGGVYERMVGLVKNSLLTVLGSATVDYITLNTVLCQVENLVNSRPLTYVSPDEILETVTPNSYLRPARESNEGSINIDPEKITSSASLLLPAYKQVRNLVEHFRSVFYSRYLPLCRAGYAQRHQAPKGAVSYSPRSGEIVLVKVSDGSRAKWPLGVVERLEKGQAWVRIVDWEATYKLPPQTVNDPKRLYATKVVQKSINRLYPLELPGPSTNTQDITPSTLTPDEVPNTSSACEPSSSSSSSGQPSDNLSPLDNEPSAKKPRRSARLAAKASILPAQAT